MSGRVLVVAKAPAPGRSKTRLVPPLRQAQAARLQEALLLDTLQACRAAVADVRVLHGGPDDVEPLQRLAGDAVALVPQAGCGLADALRLAMHEHVADGPVAIVSSDVPGVPPGALAHAFDALRAGADVVLGPALDGGYWLLAMQAAHEAPFRDVPWSTPAALAVTLERCREAGLAVAFAPAWRDVDTMVDLAFLARDVDAAVAPRTAAVIAELAAAGLIEPPPRVRLTASQLVLGSPWRAVVDDALESDDGRRTGYAYLAVPRAVFVVPVTADGELLLVRQYRHPVRDFTLEVPAGSVADGEAPLQAARRELAEEVGGESDDWTHLSTFYSSSAHLSLRSDVFLARGVRVHEAHPDEDEDLAVVRLPVAVALERARAGLVAEGQTALALLLAEPHLREAR